MEQAFEQLQKLNKTDMESIVKWMKDSKIIDNIKTTEEKARALLQGTADKQCVELDKFKEALDNIATEQKSNVQDFVSKLAEQGPKVLEALKAGASAAMEVMKK